MEDGGDVIGHLGVRFLVVEGEVYLEGYEYEQSGERVGVYRERLGGGTDSG